MFSNNLVIDILKWHFRIVIVIIAIYIAVNIVVGINTFDNMSNLAKIVQTDVEHNGYLTTHDEETIRNIIREYEDVANNEVSGPSILGINKVLRNIRIYVYDKERNIGGEFPRDDESYTNSLAGPNRLNYKRQQGEILYVGVTFDYYLIVPFGFWRTSTGGYTVSNDLDLINGDVGGYDPMQLVDVDGDEVRQKFDGSGDMDGEDNWDEALTKGGMYKGKIGAKYFNEGGTDPVKGAITTYIKPIACGHYYADLDSNVGFAGDD